MYNERDEGQSRCWTVWDTTLSELNLLYLQLFPMEKSMRNEKEADFDSRNAAALQHDAKPAGTKPRVNGAGPEKTS